jgi:membrane fusion protein, multidrug efflux system
MSDVVPLASVAPARKPLRRPLVIMLAGIAAVVLLGGWLYKRASAGVNKVALSSMPKKVAVVAATSSTYQPSRRYVGTVEPWVEAKIGPQLVSAYVDTVLVRPGAQVKRGDVIATLDCRNADAIEKAVAMQARAVAAQQVASASEAARMSSLDPKFVAQNDVDQKQADAASKQAQVLALQAQAVGSSLQVSDCVLRAPFDGEIGDRQVDPGAFVRPGSSIATIVDRHTVRITADVPEQDFAAVTPGTQVRLHLLSTGADLNAKISRLAPSADPGTRTAHLEIDVDDPQRAMPVWTTAEISLDVGAPAPATTLPVTAALIRGAKANVFVVKDDVAHAVVCKLLGEKGGVIYVDPSLAPGSMVVTEGRGQLDDGDHVASAVERPFKDGAK